MTKEVASIKEIRAWADQLLNVAGMQDYCPNGLQVEGKANVGVLISGVTASEALIRAAIAQHADAILVHHGYFWRSENPILEGMKRRRIALLLQHDINLLAYHLPLDVHPDLGNNAYLRDKLGIQQEGVLTPDGLGGIGRLANPLPPSALAARLAKELNQTPQHIAGGNKQIRRLAWCSGAAQHLIERAHRLGADAYLSGEVSEQTYHFAVENRIDYYALGHHASERGGVQYLGEALARQFDLKHHFVDVPNPI